MGKGDAFLSLFSIFQGFRVPKHQSKNMSEILDNFGKMPVILDIIKHISKKNQKSFPSVFRKVEVEVPEVASSIILKISVPAQFCEKHV